MQDMPIGYSPDAVPVIVSCEHMHYDRQSKLITSGAADTKLMIRADANRGKNITTYNITRSCEPTPVFHIAGT